MALPTFRDVPKGTTDLSTVTINDTNFLLFTEGDQTITAGNNLSALTQGLSGIKFGKQARVNIPAQYALRVDVDDTSTDYSPVVTFEQAGGQVWMYPGGDESLIVRVKHTGAGFLGFMTGGTVTNHEQRNGRAYFTSDVALTNAYHGGGELTMKYKASGPTLINQDGGVINSERGFTSAYLAGGMSNWRREDTSGTLPSATTIWCLGSHRATWQLGDITTLHLRGPDAVFDISKVVRPITIGTLVIDHWALRNPANNILRAAQFGVTISSATILYDEQDTL